MAGKGITRLSAEGGVRARNVTVERPAVGGQCRRRGHSTKERYFRAFETFIDIPYRRARWGVGMHRLTPRA